MNESFGIFFRLSKLDRLKALPLLINILDSFSEIDMLLNIIALRLNDPDTEFKIDSKEELKDPISIDTDVRDGLEHPISPISGNPNGLSEKPKYIPRKRVQGRPRKQKRIFISGAAIGRPRGSLSGKREQKLQIMNNLMKRERPSNLRPVLTPEEKIETEKKITERKEEVRRLHCEKIAAKSLELREKRKTKGFIKNSGGRPRKGFIKNSGGIPKKRGPGRPRKMLSE